jgi:PhnB protein
MATINPYLGFDDTCEAAFNHYKSVFGGEFGMFMRFKDAPGDTPPPAEDANKVMHVSLPIAPGFVLMGSDRGCNMGKTTFGDNVSISINAESEAEADRIFNGLSAGGTVTMPMNKTFWNAYFGMFTDKFGIHWMVNYDYNQQ